MCLQVSQLWKDVVTKLGAEYPDVELSHMYIDNAAMQLIRNPKYFDVIVTGVCALGLRWGLLKRGKLCHLCSSTACVHVH